MLVSFITSFAGNAALLLVFPYIIGTALLREGESDGAIRAYVYGWLVVMSAFELIYLPCFILGVSMTDLCNIFRAVLAVLLIAALSRRNYRGHITEFVNGVVDNFSWRTAAIAAMTVVEMGLAMFCTNEANYSVGDDTYHISAAADAVWTDKLWYLEPYTGRVFALFVKRTFSWKRIIAGWDMFVGAGAKILGEEVVVFAYNGLAFALMILFYCVIYIIASRLFEDRKERQIFYLFAMVAILFTYPDGSYWSQSMLTRSWQGRSLLFGVLFPLMLCLYSQLMEKGVDVREHGRELLLLLLINIASCSVSAMSVLLFFPATVLIWIIYTIYNRRAGESFSPWSLLIFVTLLPEVMALTLRVVRGA